MTAVSGPGRGHPVVAALAAAAIIMLVLFGSWRLVNGSHEREAFVADFMSRVVDEDVVESPDAESVARFFMRELGMNIVPVAIERARVSRAMVCLIKGKRAAMGEYLVDGRVVAHYQVPLTGGIALNDQEISTASEQGVQVARWTDDRFEHALVSELPEETLAHLAEQQFATR